MGRRALVALALVVAGVVAITPFALGYIVGYTDGMGPPRTLIHSWLAAVHLAPAERELPAAAGPSPDIDALFRPFWEAWDYVHRDFFDDQAIDPTTLSRGATRGLVGSLEDPYSVYLDPVHREITEAELRGAFDGIGVQVELVEDRLRIVSPLEDSPGGRADLRPGDIITHVDGRELKGMALAESIRLIRGPRGSPVTLAVEREGRPPFNVSLVREEIRVSSVRAEVRADGIAYVRIVSFTANVSDELRRALDRLAEPPSGETRAWVLDLRGNPGGYLDGAVAVASQFMDDGVVLVEQRRGGEREEIRTQGRVRVGSGPMAILVDKGTASAAEIVAAALRDNGRATLVGEQTFGKGSVQTVRSLSDGGAIRLTVARWLSPNGEPIQGVGLSPQIAVGSVAGADLALEQAIEYVNQQPARATRDGSVSEDDRLSHDEQADSSTAESERSDALVGMLDGYERASMGGPGLA
ncbi:MAG: PDZ domain-containing protein [Chloroflexi bacterium]|nr:PDZ domain-containing protein [Chloroflexota bacterium]